MNKLDILFVHPNAAEKIYQGLSKKASAIEPPIKLLENKFGSVAKQNMEETLKIKLKRKLLGD